MQRLALASRALSLSNLLDVGLAALEAAGQAGTPGSSVSAGAAGPLADPAALPSLHTVPSNSQIADEAESQVK
jgi:hypothetical protein